MLILLKLNCVLCEALATLAVSKIGRLTARSAKFIRKGRKVWFIQKTKIYLYFDFCPVYRNGLSRASRVL
jgi:hypothetical protein